MSSGDGFDQANGLKIEELSLELCKKCSEIKHLQQSLEAKKIEIKNSGKVAEKAISKRDEFRVAAIEIDRLLGRLLSSRKYRAGHAISFYFRRLVPQFLRPIVISIFRSFHSQQLLSQEFSQNHEYLALHENLYKVLLRDNQVEIPSTSTQLIENGVGSVPKPFAVEKVSIVSVIYNKESSLDQFVEAISRQDFPGSIEIILVDDVSTDNSRDVTRKLSDKYNEDNLEVKLYCNLENVGNCASRNTALEKATGDVVVVIDVDCIVNRSFVSTHARSHSYGYDVCIGPMGIESRGRDVKQLVKLLDGAEQDILREMNLQNMKHLNSSVNCVTRNFSITSAFLNSIDRPLFDERFSYRNTPDTGFGWEDVEMGTMLFETGASISFSWEAFSVHMTHQPEVSDDVKARGSLKNFVRLLKLHPGLYDREPEWIHTTGQKIRNWAQKYNTESRELEHSLENVLIAKEKLRLKEGKVLIYSAVSDGYDERHGVLVNRDNLEYSCFSDDVEHPDCWQIKRFDYIDEDPCRTAKKPKILPHIYFPFAEWSIWIDGNIDIAVDPQSLIEEVEESGLLIGMFRHPERQCLYDEAERCIVRKKDNLAAILDQVQRYSEEEYPVNNGLAECNVIVRKHNHPKVMKVMCDWWKEIRNGSRRDQLSFPYVLWKNGMQYCELNNGIGNVRTDWRFRYRVRDENSGNGNEH